MASVRMSQMLRDEIILVVCLIGTTLIQNQNTKKKQQNCFQNSLEK